MCAWAAELALILVLVEWWGHEFLHFVSSLEEFAKTIPEIADPVFWICRSATRADDDCSALIDDDCSVLIDDDWGVLICLRAALRTINIRSIWETLSQIRLSKRCCAAVVRLCH